MYNIDYSDHMVVQILVHIDYSDLLAHLRKRWDTLVQFSVAVVDYFEME